MPLFRGLIVYPSSLKDCAAPLFLSVEQNAWDGELEERRGGFIWFMLLGSSPLGNRSLRQGQADYNGREPVKG